jgi:acyl-[acyl carrier protein]--UDP-N-acetylglucosamine O-acyltransferase
MKKLYFLLIGLLLSISGISQSCLPEGIIFETQYQIDNFQVNYPGCAVIEGDVRIYGDSSITNLNGLNSLMSIAGNLEIGLNFEPANFSLTTLTGLENLTSIGEGLSIHSNASLTNLTGLNNLTSIGEYLQISANYSLTSLTGLENLNYIGGDVEIIYNFVLTDLAGLQGITSLGGGLLIGSTAALISLTGLESLTSISGNLRISYTNSLYALTGLDNLSYVGGDIEIIDNENLNILTGLEKLTSIGGTLVFDNNDILSSFVGLDSLSSIGGYLLVYRNAALTSMMGMNSLITIGGGISIVNNNVLTSLSGLENIDAGALNSLGIVDNDILSLCEVQSICDFLANPNGAVTIYNNAAGCDNPSQVANACGISLACLPYGDYYMTEQSAIDSFQVNYPGCADLEGNVIIWGNDITNLDGFNEVISIGGGLYINNNKLLISLTGLENLNSIGGGLQIIGDSILTTLTGLDGLTSIGGQLIIEENDSLVSLSGLDNIEAGSILDLFILHNPSLSNCEVQSVCEYLINPVGDADIRFNATGCNSNEEVEAACGVGLNEPKSSENLFTLSPNPSSTNITIETKTSSSKFLISIFNFQGQEVIQWQTSGGKSIIDVSTLPAGIYFVRMTGERAVSVEKFVKIE